MLKNLPIRVWTERIDRETYAIICRCYIVHRAAWYGLAAFSIVDYATVSRWDRAEHQKIGELKIRHLIKTEHGGRLPYVGKAYNGIDQ